MIYRLVEIHGMAQVITLCGEIWDIILGFIRDNSGFFGVVVGSLLTYFLSGRIEKMKHKRLIKANLIKQLHVFFSYWKTWVTLANHIRLKMRLTNDLAEEIHSPLTIDQTSIERKKRKFEIDEKDLFRKTDSNLEYSEKMMETESEIESLLVQVLEFHGKRKYKKVDELVRPYLDKSHQKKVQYDFLSINDKVLQEAKQKLEQELDLVKSNLTQDLKELVKALGKVI